MLRTSFIIGFLAFVLNPVMTYAQASIDVLIYSGPASSGNLLTRVIANQSRPDVNAALNISGDHGFSWIVPQNLHDGVARSLYVYGVNNNASGPNTLLSNSPMTIQCSPPAPATPPAVTLIASPTNVSWWTGGTVNLIWSTSDASSCTASGDWSGAKSVNGSQNVMIYPFASDKTYVLTCSNGSGATARSVTVTVGGSATSDLCTNIPGEQTSVPQGYTRDASGNCTPDTGACTDPIALNNGGASPCLYAQCADGIDNDADAKIDFPADPGCMNATDDSENTDTGPCTVNCPEGGINDGSGGGPSGNSGPGGTSSPTSGFTVSGAPRIAIQFLASLGATSEPTNLSVNPVSHFTAPVTLSVQSIRSVSGAELPSDVVPTYYFGGVAASSVLMTYNSTFGQYVGQNGLIGTTFAVRLSKKVSEKYLITILGSSGTQQSTFVIELDPNSINPDFREI